MRASKAKADWATDEERYRKMLVYTKNCEETIAAINLTLRKLLHNTNYKFVSPKLHYCLESLLEGKLLEYNK
jgi:hypothetical protein